MTDVITKHKDAPQSVTQKRSIANLDVIIADYADSPITKNSYAAASQITNFINLLIDVYGLQDTVAYSAPILFQRMLDGNSDRIKNFITNLKETTDKFFIIICINEHWTFFYYDKHSATSTYFNPLNRGRPKQHIIDIVERIISEAFGDTKFTFKFFMVPEILKQTDNINCGFFCMFYKILLIRNISFNSIVNFDIIKMKNDVATIFEDVTKKREISVDAFENILQSTLLQNFKLQHN